MKLLDCSFGLVILNLIILMTESKLLVHNPDNNEKRNSVKSRIKRESKVTSTSQAEQDEAVEAHNFFRSKEGASDMEFMVFNQFLADMAQEWADKCIFDHGGQSKDGQPYPQIGQNLLISTGDRLNYTWSVEMWFNEKDWYTFDSKTCDPGKVCGHYTQVVWSKSEAVGCGAKKCDIMTELTGPQRTFENYLILVCDYGPAGNVNNQPVYLKGPPCTTCHNGIYTCHENLCRTNCADECTCKAQCKNCGSVSENCTCGCVNGWLGHLCDEACSDLDDQCQAVWPASYCDYPDPNIAAEVRKRCPLMCGGCSAVDPNFVCTATTTTVAMETPVITVTMETPGLPTQTSNLPTATMESSIITTSSLETPARTAVATEAINSPTVSMETPSMPRQTPNFTTVAPEDELITVAMETFTTKTVAMETSTKTNVDIETLTTECVGEGCIASDRACSLNCKADTCDQNTGKCICKDGYYGEYCTESCSEHCADVSCDQYSGTCGPCTPGFYGPSCQQGCSEHCTDVSCDQYNGTCSPCTPGFYSPSCQQACFENCKDKVCDQIGGECVCEDGYYFTNCSERCSPYCHDKICNQTTGECNCKKGYMGTYCKRKISVGSFVIESGITWSDAYTEVNSTGYDELSTNISIWIESACDICMVHETIFQQVDGTLKFTVTFTASFPVTVMYTGKYFKDDTTKVIFDYIYYAAGNGTLTPSNVAVDLSTVTFADHAALKVESTDKEYKKVPGSLKITGGKTYEPQLEDQTSLEYLKLRSEIVALIQRACIKSGQPCIVSELHFELGSVVVIYSLKIPVEQSVGSVLYAMLETFENDKVLVVDATAMRLGTNKNVCPQPCTSDCSVGKCIATNSKTELVYKEMGSSRTKHHLVLSILVVSLFVMIFLLVMGLGIYLWLRKKRRSIGRNMDVHSNRKPYNLLFLK